jgi:hypothetical protein
VVRNHSLSALLFDLPSPTTPNLGSLYWPCHPKYSRSLEWNYLLLGLLLLSALCLCFTPFSLCVSRLSIAQCGSLGGSSSVSRHISVALSQEPPPTLVETLEGNLSRSLTALLSTTPPCHPLPPPAAVTRPLLALTDSQFMESHFPGGSCLDCARTPQRARKACSMLPPLHGMRQNLMETRRTLTPQSLLQIQSLSIPSIPPSPRYKHEWRSVAPPSLTERGPWIVSTSSAFFLHKPRERERPRVRSFRIITVFFVVSNYFISSTLPLSLTLSLSLSATEFDKRRCLWRCRSTPRTLFWRSDQRSGHHHPRCPQEEGRTLSQGVQKGDRSDGRAP